MKHWIVGIALLLVLLFGLLFYSLHQKPTGHSEVRVGTIIEHHALPQLTEDQLFHLPNDLKHPLSIVHIWATWCGTCRSEMVQWTALLGRVNHLPVHRIGVLYKDDKKQVLQWLRRYGNPYDIVLFDDGALAIDLGVYGTPETYLIDQKGQVLAKHVGVISEKVWQQVWLPLIQQKRGGI